MFFLLWSSTHTKNISRYDNSNFLSLPYMCSRYCGALQTYWFCPPGNLCTHSDYTYICAYRMCHVVCGSPKAACSVLSRKASHGVSWYPGKLQLAWCIVDFHSSCTMSTLPRPRAFLEAASWFLHDSQMPAIPSGPVLKQPSSIPKIFTYIMQRVL